MSEIKLSAPQGLYLNGMKSKYRAYVGGFGCVHPDTKVWTERGLMRISDITSPIRVLSWNEKDQQFQLSLSGGSFPKGRANLFRVVTQQGEFRATEHHRFFSSLRTYEPVGGMAEGLGSLQASPFLLRSIEEHGLSWLPVDAESLNQKVADLMGGYASEARQYGLRLLMEEGGDQSGSPSPCDAHKLFRESSRFDTLHKDGFHHTQQAHIRHGQFFDQSCMLGFEFRSEVPALIEEHQTLTLLPEHTLHYRQPLQLSHETCEHHRTAQGCAAAARDQNLLLACGSPSVVDNNILEVSEAERNCVYYDMQVLNTNNYVDEFGFIHHNSGKTFVGCLDLITFMAKHPGTRVGYFGPTYPAIRDIFYPTFEEAAHLLGFTVDIKETNKEVHLFRCGNYYGTVICRSMDNPGSIVGFKVSRALTDELDVLSRDKAEQAWNKIAARMRLVIPGVVNSIGVTTTPEGFKFVYEKFKQDPTASYSMVQASTYENEEFLPPDYISSLKETYPSQLIEAYLGGQFVNLTSGTVYHAYNRERCRSRETIKEGEPLFIGQDFNVGKMASTVYVQRPNGWHIVAELSDLFDTPDVIRVMQERWGDHRIVIYPDASGKNRKSVGASSSDIALFEQARFEIRVKSTNPAVRDRVLAMNKALESGKVWVNDAACQNTARCLEQQAYDKNGDPDKTGGVDHQNDATGYVVAYEMPVIKPMTKGIKFG